MDLKNYKIKSPQKKFNARWEVLADEMTEYFKRNCFWLFYKFEEWKIENAFKACREKGIDKLPYLIGILKK